jgi:hypothetical protein
MQGFGTTNQEAEEMYVALRVVFTLVESAVLALWFT